MHNPTAGLRSARILKKDRPVIDPFRIEEAETLIAAIHRDWGEAQGNYGDLNLVHGTVRISKARVAGGDKDTTKTGDDWLITLCAHALKIAKRQLLLWEIEGGRQDRWTRGAPESEVVAIRHAVDETSKANS